MLSPVQELWLILLIVYCFSSSISQPRATISGGRAELHDATPKAIVDFYAKKAEQRNSIVASEISALTIPSIRTPYNPFTFEFHTTRYFGGCFHHRSTDSNPTPPFLRSFQFIITNCGVSWGTGVGVTGAQKSCVYRWNERDPMQIEHYNRSRYIPHSHGVLRRIHIHSDHKHHTYFIQNIWPILLRRAKETGERYIFHSGGGDSPPSSEVLELFVNSSIVEKWIVEQALSDEFLKHPKIVLMPIGICQRENLRHGAELRQIMNKTRAMTNMTLNPQSSKDDSTEENNSTVLSIRDRYNSHNRSDAVPSSLSAFRDTRRSLLLEMAASVRREDNGGWQMRLNKIFFCFSPSVQKRREILRYLAENPTLLTFCDVCDGTLSRSELWTKYTQYKFVFAPWGNGADCFRNWEILLLGAVPVVQYFAGAHGYLRAGLSVVLVHSNGDLTYENVTRWAEEFQGPSPLERLTGDWWLRYLFS
jgi:hypothetical protein